MSIFRRTAQILLIALAIVAMLFDVFVLIASRVNNVLLVFSSTVAIIATGVFVVMLFQLSFLERKSFFVAIVGFAESGKTTLIISLFGEAYARRLPVRVVPRGSHTIAVINKSLELLKKGKALGPTTDQDMYGFRADATIGKGPFATTYRLEFGDFPGAYSKEYRREDMHLLHNSEFFKWIVDSDAIMFVIDLGRYLTRNKRNFIAEVTSAFRTEWQQYLDANSFRLREIKRHPVIIVFTKTDLLYRVSSQINLQNDKELSDIENLRNFEETVAHFGFGEDAPPLIKLDEKRVQSDTHIIEEEFGEIIQFFKAEASSATVVFTSSFGLVNGELLGFRKLFASILKDAK
ncbi:MAG: GTPase domain-containing protein [Candidatus Bathyarchaeia archaeon]|jgi:GTPase SAR1 family protein